MASVWSSHGGVSAGVHASSRNWVSPVGAMLGHPPPPAMRSSLSSSFFQKLLEPSSGQVLVDVTVVWGPGAPGGVSADPPPRGLSRYELQGWQWRGCRQQLGKAPLCGTETH